ncbi:MAG: Flagellar motor switch protein FliM, partial [Pseudomonadota bacterium]
MTDAAFAESADPFADDAEAEDARPSSLSERVLNQDEIDSLLGFDLGEADDAERTGIRAIINSALVSYERLPMLEIVFDRLVRLMTT